MSSIEIKKANPPVKSSLYKVGNQGDPYFYSVELGRWINLKDGRTYDAGFTYFLDNSHSLNIGDQIVITV